MLDIDISTILWQILNFLLLAALLSKLLYQPALRYMRERAAKVGQSMDDAKKTQAEAEAMRQLLSEQLNGAAKGRSRSSGHPGNGTIGNQRRTGTGHCREL